MLCHLAYGKFPSGTSVGEAGFEIQGSTQAVGISPSVLGECDDVLCQWQAGLTKG